MKKLLAVPFLFLTALASAQTAADLEKLNKKVLVTKMAGGNLTSEAKQKAADLGSLLANESLKGLANSPKMTDYEAIASNVARKADDIADAAMAKDRREIMEFLGINPDGGSALYYFVTWEMPIEVLRSYAVEAMWSGGTLIFKGIPKGMDLNTFLTQNLSSLVYGKGAASAISIDPRLFDAYKITTAPTIVYTEERRNFECVGGGQEMHVAGSKDFGFSKCPPLDPSKYWKITGAITTDFALRQFIDSGANGAKPFLTALAKGFGEGQASPKLQQAYSGDWKSELTPSEVKAARGAADMLQQSK